MAHVLSAKRNSRIVNKVGEQLAGYVELKKVLENVDGIDEQTLLDTLEGETELHEALCVLAEEIQAHEAMIEGLGAKIKEMTERKDRHERTIETLRGIILMSMDRAELDTVQGPVATLSRSRTKPGLEIVDEATIPAKFFVPQDPKLDKKALREALENGETVAGATLGNGGISLTIRKK